MEEEAEYKSEYCLGEIFAMTGASINPIKDERNRWILEDLTNMEDILTVRSVGVELPLKRIYRRLDMEKPPGISIPS